MELYNSHPVNDRAIEDERRLFTNGFIAIRVVRVRTRMYKGEYEAINKRGALY